jgi:hypothetical protein
MSIELQPIPKINSSPVSGVGTTFDPIYYTFNYSMFACVSDIRTRMKITSLAADPTTSDIQDGDVRVFENTTSGQVRWWVNHGGTLKSIQFT